PQVRGIKDRIMPAPDDGAGTEDEQGRINRRRTPVDSAIQTGSFAVLNGVVYVGNETEPATRRDTSTKNINKDAQQRSPSVMSGNTVTRLRNHRLSLLSAPDVVTADDAIIQGSLCVGLDCVNNESFGFDTIRLKENNTRIKFDDTSTTAGCPNNDWQLTANDACGGASKFSIEDITGAKVPFTVTAGAPTNSFFVASSGKIGLGNSAPGMNMQVQNAGTSVGFGVVRTENNGDMDFFTGTTGGNVVERLRVLSGGNVGIACNAPTFAFMIGSGSGCSVPTSGINPGSTSFT